MRSIQQEDVSTMIVCASNSRIPGYLKQRWIDSKKDIDSNTTIMWDFNSSLLSTEKSIR